MDIKDYIDGLNDIEAIEPLYVAEGYYVPRVNREKLVEYDEEVNSIVLNNMNHCVVNEEKQLIARGMQKLIQYRQLPRAEQMAFLGDHMTMIEFIQGRPFYASMIGEEVVLFSKHEGVMDELDIERLKQAVKPVLRIVSNKNDTPHSLALKLGLDGKIYLEAIVSNELRPEYYNEKGIDMVVNNFLKEQEGFILRPMYYTTSLNESFHKPNTEWIIRNGDNYCLLLNKLKKEVY